METNGLSTIGKQILIFREQSNQISPFVIIQTEYPNAYTSFRPKNCPQ